MRSRVLLGMAAVLLLATGLLGTPAAAHASYVSSNPPASWILPTAPLQVSITFSEAIQPDTQSIRVTNASGGRVDVGGAVVSPADPRTVTVGLAPIGTGVYGVVWGVLSAVDGHFTTGSFSFGVGNVSGSIPGASSSGAPLSLVEVFLRFLVFAGLAIAVGGTAVAILVWIPAGRELEASGDPGFEWGFRALASWARIGALLAAVGAGAWWVHVATGAPPEAAGAVATSGFALTLAARAVLGLAIAGALSLVLLRAGKGRPAERPPGAAEDADGAESALLPLLAAAVLGVLAVLAGSAGSHAAASRLPLIGIAVDATHQIGVYAWVGALMTIVRLRPWLRDTGSLPLAGGVYRRFSELAGYAVVLVLAAGIVLGLLLVESLDALIGTPYGWTLIAKVSLFIPMVVLGAVNRYRVLPRSSPDALPSSVAVVARNVRIEAAIGATVLVLAALLTAIAPAAAPPQGGLYLQATSDGIRFDFSVDPSPSVPGVYQFTLLLTNASTGAPYNDARSGNLTFILPPDPPQTVPLVGPHGNHLYVVSPAMSRPGAWRIDATIIPTIGFPVRATFNVVIAAPP